MNKDRDKGGNLGADWGELCWPNFGLLRSKRWPAKGFFRGVNSARLKCQYKFDNREGGVPFAAFLTFSL